MKALITIILAVFSALFILFLIFHSDAIEDYIHEIIKKKKLENKKRELELDMMELDYKQKKGK